MSATPGRTRTDPSLSRPNAPGLLRALALAACAVAAVSCGGGSSGVTSKFPPSSKYANLCATPRTGTDPFTGTTFPDKQGTATDEKLWLRSWTDELYLWYREVPAADPNASPTPLDYFDVLKTPAITPSGRAKDQFHFTQPTAATEQQFGAGVEAGYGVRWVLVASRPPREVRVAYLEPQLPAANAGANLARGAKVLTVDGVDVVNGTDVTTLNAGLFPAAAGESHAFMVQDAGTTGSRLVTLTSDNVVTTPVQNVKPVSGTTWYVQYNDHIATAEQPLVTAFNQMKQAGATDLVLDMRYNGGGFLDLASELGFMISGAAGKTFEQIVFNDKYPGRDPVSGNPVVTPFHSVATGLFPLASGTALPHLDLRRVFILTTSGTCSASESVINSLRGVDVNVVQIGTTTCGKPYGFYPADDCGTTYFSIQFQGVNAKGFGDYADGFTPGGTGGASPPGCVVADDWAHALGDPAEAQLAAALQYASSGTCPPAPAAVARSQALTGGAAGGPALTRPPLREIRILRR